MERNQILDQLDLHDRVHTREEAINWKKSLQKKMTLAEKRRNAMQFFNNPTMTTDMNRVNNAIQSISNEEKVFKMGLKKDIAREEYKKLGEEPKKQNQNKDNRNKDVMTPPDNFSTDTHYTHNEDFSEFKCTECGEEFSFQQDAIIHME